MLPIVASLVLVASAGFADRSLPITRPLDRVWESDAYWTDDFAVPGVNGAVGVVEANDADLYVGGWFTQTDGVDAPGLARFDGRNWEPFPEASAQPPTAMLKDGSDMLLAGDFLLSAGRQRVSVVRWSARGVAPVGENGLHGNIVRLFRLNRALIAAGSFRFEDDPSRSYMLAQLSGNRWTPLGPPAAGHYAQASDAVVFQDRIAIGGFFSDDSGRADHGLWYLRGDGSAFDPLLHDSLPYGSRIERLAVHEGRLIASGLLRFEDQWQGTIYRILAAWDGTTWTPLLDEHDRLGGQISALRSTPDGLLIGGRINLDGASFDPVSVAKLDATGIHGIAGLGGTQVLSLTMWQGRITAGGRLVPQYPDTREASRSLAVLNGADWESPGAPDRRVTGLDSYYGSPGNAMAQTFLDAEGGWFVGGRFDLAWRVDGWHEVGPVARWEPGGWTSYGTNRVSGNARALAWYQGYLYAGGTFQLETPNGYFTRNLIRSNGAVWETVDGAPTQGEVTSLALYGDRLIVGGLFWDADSMNLRVSGIVGYDGANWSTVGDATHQSPSGTRIYALLSHDGSLYAAGWFDSLGGVAAHAIARWDGTAWHPVGEGYPGEIHALIVHQNRLTMSGTCFAPSPCDEVMTWDGAGWRAIPGAPNGVVTMASSQGILFVGGSFSGTTSFSADRALRAWDGTSWHALGSGLQLLQRYSYSPQVVMSLAIRDNLLWVGGGFTRAGGQSAMSVATWTGLTYRGRRDSHSLRDGISLTPNPSRTGSPIDLSIDGEGATEIGIYDLAGRRLHALKTASDGERASATWDGRDADGKSVPAGIYFARATREGRVIATRRLIRLP
jgi:hypothetical protein